jgi:hypothetical protein
MALGDSSVAVAIVLSARDEMAPGMASAEGKIGKLEKATGLLKSAFAGVVASGAIGFLSDAARAAQEDEVNTIRLRTAIENTGVAYGDVAAAIDATIKKGQALAFSDDQVRDSVAQLSTALGDVSKAVELQGLVADVARGRNIDLGAATDIVQKAALGQFGALKKLGIVLDENATAVEALSALQAQNAGQAEAHAASTTGAMFRIKDSIDEWVESMGASLGPLQGMIGLLPGLQSGATIAGGALGMLAKHVDIAAAAKRAAIPVMHLAGGALRFMLGPIGLVITAVGLLALAWETNFLGIRDIVAEVAPQVIAFINTILGPIRMLIDLVRGALDWLGQLTSFRVSMPTITLPTFSAPTLAPVPVAVPTASQQIERLRRGIPIFQEGGVMPHTGLAWLHQGERVLTAGAMGSPAGPTVVVKINGDVVGLSKTDLAQELWRIATQQRRMQGLA